MKTGHIKNILLNQYLYVYFDDVTNGEIQLVPLLIESYDGGLSAKWKIVYNSDGTISIRPLLNTSYAISVRSIESVGLLHYTGSSDQKWIPFPV